MSSSHVFTNPEYTIKVENILEDSLDSISSSSPFWNQTFVYPDITLGQLRSQYLDISAWSHNYHAPSEFLGEITLDLSGKFVFSLMAFLSFQIRRTAPPHTFTKNELRVETNF